MMHMIGLWIDKTIEVYKITIAQISNSSVAHDLRLLKSLCMKKKELIDVIINILTKDRETKFDIGK